VELVVGGAFLVASLIVIGLFVAMFSLIVWLVVLPFKLLGLLFHSALWLIFAVPFMLLIGFVGMLVLGAGLIAFLVPAFPLVLLALGIWWLVKRRQQPAAQTH
jgi:hypothetical protein